MKRCPYTIWRYEHEPIWSQVRDAQGRPTGVWIWTCFRCWREVGRTDLRPVITPIRRQAHRVEAGDRRPETHGMRKVG